MGFSSQKYGKKKEDRPWKVHPIWRGIGCFMAIIMPIMAWAGADLFLQTNTIVPLPPELYRSVVINTSSTGIIHTVITSFNNFMAEMGVTYGKIFFLFVFLFLGYGLLSILYSIMYRVMGPPRYSQFDARPIKAPKRKK